LRLLFDTKYLYVLCGITLYLFLCFIIRNNLSHKSSYIWSDAEGYYSYLPAWFIYDGFDDLPIRTKVQFRRHATTNNYFIKYTCGVAILQAPFFLVTHASTRLSNPSIANGYSKPYQISIFIGAALWVLLGLYFLFLSLRYLKSKKWCAIFIASMCLLGTNLMYYTFWEPCMSHCYSFSLISIFLFFNLRYKESLITKYPLLTGFLIALIGLIRPTNLIVVLFPIYYLIKAHRGFRSLYNWILANCKNIIMIITPCMMLIVMQAYQWKIMTGKWLLNSYANTDKGFIYLKNPKVLDVLFGADNSIFPYTPLLFLCLLTMFILVKSKRSVIIISLVIFCTHCYLCASWWKWTFAGAFAYRPIVDILPILFTPLGMFLGKLSAHRHPWVSKFFAFLCFILAYYSFGLILQYEYPWEAPNWTYENLWKEVVEVFSFRFRD